MKKIMIFATVTAAMMLASCCNKAVTSDEATAVEDSVRTMDLREAYNALSKIPNVSTVNDDIVNVSIDKGADYNGIIQIARAQNLDREEIYKSGNSTYAILNQIPLSYMINGGNNGYVGAFVYCTPNVSGSNDMLIVTMSGAQGDLTFVLIPDVDNNTKINLTEAQLTMQGDSLSIIPQESGGKVNIRAIKVNCN